MEENQFIFTQQMEEEVTKLRKMQQDNSSLIFCCPLCFKHSYSYGLCSFYSLFSSGNISVNIVIKFIYFSMKENGICLHLVPIVETYKKIILNKM